MSKLETGGSAFPTSIATDSDGRVHYGEPGMTLRQWYAGKALAGLLAADVTLSDPSRRGRAARDAFALADAMIAEAAK